MKIKSIIFALITFSLSFAQNDFVKVHSGHVLRIPGFESKFVDARNVDIWLPEGYCNSKKYGVLYMHDGQMLFDATITWNKQEWGVDETLTSLIDAKKIDAVIVVGIWNNGAKRHPEYFPQKPFEAMTKSDQLWLTTSLKEAGRITEDFKPISDNYLSFIVKELKPWIDKTFSTIPNREHTFIAGSSMGGLISMYALCEYPNVFGGAACLSTHWPGAFHGDGNPIPNYFNAYLKNNLPKPDKHKIYFDFGTATLDALYPPLQAEVDKIMKQKKYTEKHWRTERFEGADHSENAWRERLEIPFTFLLK
jgi:enterochelin esterase-like enzyme